MASSPPLTSTESVSESGRTSSRATAVETGHSGARQAGVPDVVTTRRSTGWYWWLAIAVLTGAGWYYRETLAPHLTVLGLGRAAVPKETAVRPTPVSIATVEQRDMPLYLNGLGTVTALKTVTIRSRVEGEITKIAFTEGQMVNEGDLLAEIDPRPYQVQKEQAEGQLARDDAALKTAKLTLARLKQLFEMKIATAQQVDDQSGLVQQSEGAVQADNAQIAQAELQLSYCRILAPISGRIGLRLVDEGNMVRPNDAQGLAVVTQLQPISLVFTLPQDDIVRVQQRMGADGKLTVEAYDRDLRNRLAIGKLLAVDNQVDPTNGTVRLKAEFENADGLLFPNQFVNVRLLVETQVGALVIPGAAVQRGPNGTFVYVVGSDDSVELRNVTVSATERGQSAIGTGLAAGEVVVTAGLDRLRPGAPVTTKIEKDDKPATEKGK